MNAFLFCTRFPELVRCTLVGANQYGKMAWVVTTPGRELESLDDFMEGACEGWRYKLLCLEGEMADSMSVLKMMGALTDCVNVSVKGDMCYLISQMAHYDIKWRKDGVDLEVTIFSAKVGDRLLYDYAVFSQDGNEMIFEERGFSGIDVLVKKLKHFFKTFKQETGIDFYLTLRTREDIFREIPLELTAFFDNVDTY